VHPGPLHQQCEAWFAAATTETRQAANHDQALNAMAAEIHRLTNAITPPVVPSPPAPVPPSPWPAPELQMGMPERYTGDPEGCNPFLMNCSILFALQPHTFAFEEAKVEFIINHLTGRAHLWGTAKWERWTPTCGSLQWFTTEFRSFSQFSVGRSITLMSIYPRPVHGGSPHCCRAATRGRTYAAWPYRSLAI